MALATIGLATACGADEESMREDTSSASTPGRGSYPTVVTEGTPEQRALLARILSGMGESSIVETEFTNLPPGFSTPADSSNVTWLSITIAADTSAEYVKGYWHALLVVGALRDLGEARGLPLLIGKTVVVRSAEGNVRDAGSSVIDQPPRHIIEPTSEGILTTMVREGGRRAGVDLRAIQFISPSRLGAMIEVTAEDPLAFVTNRGERLYELLAQGRLVDRTNPLTEGMYVEVRDAAGRLVTISAYSTRTGEGVGWVRPDLRAQAQHDLGSIQE